MFRLAWISLVIFLMPPCAFGGEKPINLEVGPNEPPPGAEESLEIGKGINLRLCWIPPGKFKMGSPETEKARDQDEVEHVVNLTGFWMAKFPVTQKQYVTLGRRKNPSEFCLDGKYKDKIRGLDTDDFPLENVS
jgi:formylglycine-generating enzyme required for sulfatase activity